MIEYAFVPFHAVSDEIAQKMGDLREGLNEKYPTIKVDWDYYLESSIAGIAYVVSARDGGKLIGYSIFFIANNANHKDIIEATNSLIYVDKPYRGRVGIEIIVKADQYLKACGVHVTNYELKDQKIGKLLARKGYAPESVTWSKKYE